MESNFTFLGKIVCRQVPRKIFFFATDNIFVRDVLLVMGYFCCPSQNEFEKQANISRKKDNAGTYNLKLYFNMCLSVFGLISQQPSFFVFLENNGFFSQIQSSSLWW